MRRARKKGVMQYWLNSFMVTVFDENKQNIFSQYDNCLSLHGDYVEKKLNVGTNMSDLFAHKRNTYILDSSCRQLP